MDLGDGLGHLTYSTLVHAGDTWDEMRESLADFVPRVKRRVSPEAPFGVSLRLSAASASHLTDEPGRRRELREFLAANGLYLYTVNAFPYGPFKGRLVKEQVYEPDWRTEDRVRYTCQVADILAEVSPAHVNPSIQSAPLAFARNVHGAADVRRLTRNLLRVVAHLLDLERRTGRRVTLALEPEPACHLETTQETVAYFQRHVYSAAGTGAFADLAGVPMSEAHAALRRHLGVVFDVCHQAVGFEDIPASLAALEAAGIPVFKLQEAAALRVPEVTAQAVAELERLTDTIYLSQTTQLRDGVLRKFLNLEDAIAAWHEDPGPAEWRTHFHVPVFLDRLGPFHTTRFALEDALRVHATRPQSAHLEIETYTWDVLPEQFKDGDIVDYLSRELEWVRARLAGQNGRRAAAGR
ncbi:metabolite traffic protein EboE [Actinomadura scrupuli]|uniref:metabolite traffic protein EboE n=1 Tax=Actinomadura scrupuli TaxID=559629 RepID=UPI003D999B21